MTFTGVLEGQTRIDDAPPRSVEVCPDCGLVLSLTPLQEGSKLLCPRCGHAVERTAGRSLDAAFAITLSALMLLVPANLLPLLKVNIFGVHHASVIASGIVGIADQGWPLVAAILAAELLLLPFVRFGLLAAVLFEIYRGKHHRWLGPCFRWSERVDQWSMPDVFLIGCMIGYGRVAPFLPIDIGVGGWCVIAVAFLTLLTRATLERREIWRRIGPVRASIPSGVQHIGCPCCGLPVPASDEGRHCPRCGERIWRYRPHTWMRTLALTLAGLACYPFAYLYPMEYNYQMGALQGYSIMTGVFKLIDAHFYVFAVIIFLASVIIPFLKLFGLSWFIASVHWHSTSRLPLKTRLYRVISVIGRWSHIDVFTVAVFLPLMHLSGVLAVYVGKALPAFLAVVIITMFAAEAFDPRLLWKAADEKVS